MSKRALVTFFLMLSICMLASGAQAGALNLSQTLPPAYRNDAAGQNYQLAVSNPLGAYSATTLSVSVNIPAGYFLVPGSVSASAGNPVNVAGADPFTITLAPAYKLTPGSTLTLAYRLGTDCTALTGQSPVAVTASYVDEPGNPQADSNTAFVNLSAGLIAVDLEPVSPLPFDVEVGDTVELSATIENIGAGTLFSVPFSANWGTGFDTPALNGGSLTPVLNGNSYEITTAGIPAGESRSFNFTLRVASCDNLTLDVTATDPCPPGDTYTDDSSPFLLLKQPNITIAPSNATLPYCGMGNMTLDIDNLDAPANTRGEAYNFVLTTSLPGNVTVNSVSAGWTHGPAGTFTLDAGAIPAGASESLVISLEATDACNGASGTLLFTPNYTNACGDAFAPPIVAASYNSLPGPTLSISKTAVAAGGDTDRVFLGEGVTFTVTPGLSDQALWSGDITITDNVPAQFTVTGVNAPPGTVNQVGNSITWTLSPAQAAAAPSLVINATASTDPCDAGQLISNTAHIAGTTNCGCNEADSDGVSLFLQSKNAPAAVQLVEEKSILNPPDAPGFDICDLATVIQYSAILQFDAASSGTWSDSVLTELLEGRQSYVDGTLQYSVGGAFFDVPAGSITDNSPNSLVVTLDFLGTEANAFPGNDLVMGQTVEFRFNLKPTSAALGSCTASGSFYARTQILVNDNPAGCASGDDSIFFLGVETPVSRAALALGIGLGTESVTKSQEINPTITVNKLTPWTANNVVIVLDTTNYKYLGNPVYGGGLGPPDSLVVNDLADTVTFTYNSLGAGASGTIGFDAVKTCTDDYEISASLDYDDVCDAHCNDAASDSPTLQLAADIVINATPDQVLVTASQLSWTIYVTNKGSGTAYNVELEDTLGALFDYVSSTVDGVGAAPAQAGNVITWSLGTLSPNKVCKVAITVDLNGTSCNFANVNTIVARYGWIDPSGPTYVPCDTEMAAGVPIFAQRPTMMSVTNHVDADAPLCGVATIKLTFKNNGFTHNYNVVLTQSLGDTGFDYVEGSATLDGNPLGDDPDQPDAKTLVWSYASGNIAGTLDDLNIGETHTLAFDVNTFESFNADQVVTASSTWQRPCERAGVARTGGGGGAGFTVPISQPEITVDKTGWNVSAGQGEGERANTVYGGQNDTVVWRVRISNSGPAAAQEVWLRDIIGGNFLIDAYDTVYPLGAGQVDIVDAADTGELSIPDIPAGGNVTYYFEGVIQGACTNQTNAASVEWGCPGDPLDAARGGLSSPDDNNDDAFLRTIPVVSNSVDITQTITNLSGGALDNNGIVVIQVTNKGGTARKLVLTDTLPNGFVVDDSVFAPTLASSNGNLDSVVMVDGNTQTPDFSFYSSAFPQGSADPQHHILRYNETVTLTFHIVRTGLLDLTEDQDIRTETVGNGKDPVDAGARSNVVDLDYENTCGGSASASSTATLGSAMDLDIDITDPIVRALGGVDATSSFSVVIVNRGGAAAQNATVSVVIGDGFANADGGLPAGCAGAIPGTVTCDVTGLAAGGTRTIVFNLKVADETKVLTFKAQVQGVIRLEDATLVGDYSLDSIRARVIGFRMAKVLESTTEGGSGGKNVLIGEDATYRITATWFGLEGGEQVTGVTLTDPLASGTGYVTDSFAAGDPLWGSKTTPAVFANGSLVWTPASPLPSFSFDETVTVRVLNANLNAESGVNVHNSLHTNTSTAAFTYLGATYTTGSSGFPSAADRDETITVITPALTVLKEVRNNTTNPGGAFSNDNSVKAKSGDILEYHLRVSNGAGRAPAYNVAVTDVVNAKFSVRDLATDLLDNDGDGTPDGGDPEGAAVGTGPTTVTFNETDNAALASLAAGASVDMRFQVLVLDTVNPTETIANTASAAYDTLPGESGSQTIGFESLSGLASGARKRTASGAESVTMQALDITGSKTIVAVANTPAGGAFPFAGPQNVVIGEEVRFQLQFKVQPSTLANWKLVDNLPAGLMAVQGADLTLPGVFNPANGNSRTITPQVAGDGSSITWDFSYAGTENWTLPGGSAEQTITADFVARVRNIAGNQEGTNLINQDAKVQYSVAGTPSTVDLQDVTLVVREPVLSITQLAMAPRVGVDAGDILTVSVSVKNNSLTAPAYNVALSQDLTGKGLSYVVGQTGGANALDTVPADASNPQVFGYDSIPADTTYTFTYKIQVDGGIQPLETLDIAQNAVWTSLPAVTTALNTLIPPEIGGNGTAAGMRDGSGGVNDYLVSATDSFVLDSFSVTKADENLFAGFLADTIGARHSFSITIDLPEGATDNLRAVDNLSAGGVGLVLENNATYDVNYTLTGIASINGTAMAALVDNAAIEAAMVGFPADGATGTLTWNFGPVATDAEDDTPGGGAVAPRILIEYTARINNVANNTAGSTRQNAASAVFAHGETAADETVNAGAVSIDVVEPSLSVAKVARNVTRLDPDTFGVCTQPDAGDILEFRVTIVNSNVDASTAYDVNIEDSLPVGLQFTGAAPAGSITDIPDASGTGATGDAQTLTWGRTQGAPLSIDIAAGATFEFTYQVKVLGVAEPVQALQNTVAVDWTSLPGSTAFERDGSGGVNNYTDSDSFSVTTRDDTAFAKVRSSDTYGPGDDLVRIGDMVTFTLTAGLNEGTTRSMEITDVLPAGLAFVNTVSLNGDAAAPYSAGNFFLYADIPAGQTPSAGATGAISWTLGNVENISPNTAGVDDFVIVYRARITDATAFGLTPATQTVSNNAALDWVLFDSTPQQLSDSVSMDVVQPILSSTKALGAGQGLLVSPGGAAAYEVTITNTGDAPAYNTVAADTLPPGLRRTAPVLDSATLGGGPVALAPLAYNPDTGLVTWTLNDGQAIAPGQSLVINYTASVDDRVLPGTELINQASALSYYSKPDADPDARRQYPATAKDSTTVTVFGMLFRPDNEQTTQAGTSIYYPHVVDVFAAGGTADLSFAFSTSKNLVWTVFTDTNASGQLDAGDARFVNGTAMATGQYTFFFRTVTPNQVTEGWTDVTTVTASLQSGLNTVTRDVTDITRVVLTGGQGPGEVSAEKEAALDTNCDGNLGDELVLDASFQVLKDVGPGQCAVYRITFTNKGTGSISQVRVEDKVVDFSTYVAGSAAFENTPAGLTVGGISAPAGGAKGTITWTFGGVLGPGLSGSVKYTVKIDD